MMQFAALRAEAVSRQLEGDTAAVATGGLDLSDMDPGRCFCRRIGSGTVDRCQEEGLTFFVS